MHRATLVPRLNRKCGERRCPNLIPQGRTYCDDHQRGIWRENNRAPHRDYSTALWQALRRQVYVRDQGLCQCRDTACGHGRRGFTIPGHLAPSSEPCLKGPLPNGAWDCDHIQPLSQGGANEAANLQVLCLPCHRAKTWRQRPEWQREAIEKEVR